MKTGKTVSEILEDCGFSRLYKDDEYMSWSDSRMEIYYYPENYYEYRVVWEMMEYSGKSLLRILRNLQVDMERIGCDVYDILEGVFSEAFEYSLAVEERQTGKLLDLLDNGENHEIE